MANLVLALPLFTASALALFFTIQASRRRGAPGSGPFTVLMAAICWWSLTYGIELLLPTLGERVLATKFEYLGIVTVAPAWLAVALEYRSKRASVSKITVALLAVEPIVSVLFVWTNDLHHVFYSANKLVDTGPFVMMENDWGPAFWLQVSSSYAFFLGGVGLFAREAWRGDGIYRKQALTLVAGAVAPWAANLIVVAGLVKVHLDLTPFAFLLAGLAAYYALFLQRLFDLLPIAREAMFDEMAEGVMVIDSRDRVADVNAAMLDILGKTSTHVVGRSLDELGLDLPKVAHTLEDTWLTGVSIDHAAVSEARVFDLSLVALGSASEGYRGRLLVMQDVTERTIAQRELEYLNQRLEEQVAERTGDLREANVELATALNDLARTQQQIVQQERLSALGQMASGIAHEFNNSLSPIVGFSQVLLGKRDLFPEGTEERRYLEYILTAAKDGAAVVANLREFYKPKEQTKIELVDLDELTDFIVRMTRPRWREQPRSKGIEVNVERHVEADVAIMGEPTALREVFTNLLFNAVDAMPDGGTITIGVRRSGDDAIVEIGDTGIGMSQEVAAHCFEPFFSTKGESGTGLGLALVQTIVSRHGGRIDVDTALGKGTRFTITFRAANAASADGAQADGFGGKTPLRVLAIDDDRSVLAVIDALVEAEGHSVDPFSDPIEALKQLHSQHYDVVITDLAMPTMSGDQIAEAVKNAFPEMPVILITGFADALGASGEELTLTADRVLSKPVSAEKLRTALLEVTERQRA